MNAASPGELCVKARGTAEGDKSTNWKKASNLKGGIWSRFFLVNDDSGRLRTFFCFLLIFWLVEVLVVVVVVVVVLKLRKSKWFQHCLKRCLLELPKHVGGLGKKKRFGIF